MNKFIKFSACTEGYYGLLYITEYAKVNPILAKINKNIYIQLLYHP